jgi:hypothetical protein
LLSCVGVPQKPAPFDIYCLSFSEETEKTIHTIDEFREDVLTLCNSEKRVGELSNSEYDNIEKIVDGLPNIEHEINFHIQSLKNKSQSITTDGFYTGTKKKMKGWDAAAYSNLT